MVIMVFSLLRNTVAIVTRKDKVNLSQGLVLNTKMHVLREPYKQSCTWHEPSWYMPPCIGSESEGDIWGNNNYDDDASNAHEGANLVPPDFNGNEGVQPTPNITPAPEGAH